MYIRYKLRCAGNFVETFDPLNTLPDDGKSFCFCHDQCSLRFLNACLCLNLRRLAAGARFFVLLVYVMPHAFSGNPGQTPTGPPIKTFEGDDTSSPLW